MPQRAITYVALRGRLIEIAATARREVNFDLADFYPTKGNSLVWIH
jgi:hypothetical protein